jgi:ribosomal protein S18 acetylase RimI-like enzyme
MGHPSLIPVTDVALREDVRPDDCEAVRAIVERTGFFRSDEVAIAVELVEENLSRGPASGYHFVFADASDIVAGYACYGPIACTASSYDLYWVAVNPQFQRKGIGRMLMAAVESRIAAAGGTRIYIDTSGRAQYAPTRAFYDGHGFRCEARLTDFYAAGDDRLIYLKILRCGTTSV